MIWASFILLIRRSAGRAAEVEAGTAGVEASTGLAGGVTSDFGTVPFASLGSCGTGTEGFGGGGAFLSATSSGRGV